MSVYTRSKALRLTVIRSVLHQGRTDLNPLSGFPGPTKFLPRSVRTISTLYDTERPPAEEVGSGAAQNLLVHIDEGDLRCADGCYRHVLLVVLGPHPFAI